jgi:hypothetical protein
MAFEFSEGLAQASEDSAEGYIWGYIDHTGRFVIAPAYSHAFGFSEGLAAVFRYSDGGWFHIDRSGTRVLHLKGGGWGFSDGLTIAGENDRVYVDKTGKVNAPYEVNPDPSYRNH